MERGGAGSGAGAEADLLMLLKDPSEQSLTTDVYASYIYIQDQRAFTLTCRFCAAIAAGDSILHSATDKHHPFRTSH